MPKVMLISGCPRSGTTGFRTTLAQDPRMAIGLERYLKLSINKKMTPDLWERERFIDVRPEDTQVQPDHPSWDIANIIIDRVRNDYETLDYIGDKLPRSANSFEVFAETLPDIKIIYLLRNPFDVAASYNKRARNEKDKTWRPVTDYSVAVKHWNFDIRQAVKFLDQLDLHIIRYETIFRNFEEFENVYDFLGLEMNDEARSSWQGAHKRSLSLEAQRSALADEEKVHVSAHCDFGSYRKLLKHGGFL
ncbi:sulfotransferase family protein [Pseudodonghicola xiamenensis]|uniref:Sulfotransferase family protein n=1 Tax=Pseudodonghicola xiamenensis TaxID=337702 RepID=A0A8J3MDN2_9RHOB|nr:sulfotransferase [Pseudodonghicola xiamenensis]GHG97618.1 hypothetical protein GCM10010961_32460 [Pseudodonghicola xiamenensis]